MSIFGSVRKFLVPIHPEGYLFLLISFFIALITYIFLPFIGWLFWFVPCFVAYFFRDPKRIVPVGDGLIISPADGKVSDVVFCVPPPELGIGDESRLRVSIFLSVFDVHINRLPIGGVVREVVYRPGLFLNADLDKASEDNERNSVIITTNYGDIPVVQIAGLIARRILCFVKKGDNIAAGERFGLIRFGSRCDVYLPKGAVACVAVGQRAIGGETIICDLASSSDSSEKREFRVV